MGCCLSRQDADVNPRQTAEDNRLLADNSQQEFRSGRKEDSFGKHKKAKKILQCICATLCLYKPTGWGLLLSFILALTCIFQLVYDLFVISCGCQGCDFGFLKNESESHHVNASSFRKTSNTVYTLASFGGFFSYTILLMSLLLMYSRRRKYNNKAVGPSDALYDDLSNKHVKVIFTSQVILSVLFASSVALFYYLIHSQTREWHFYLMVTGVAAQFISQWAAIVGCHVFAISSLALGTLANDTIRRIKQMTQQTKSKKKISYGALTEKSEKVKTEDEQDHDPEKIEVLSTTEKQKSSNGDESDKTSFDIAMGYHEELCEIVSDTVFAYCPWFVIHWLCYGATCVIGVIYISEEFEHPKNRPFKLAYVTVFLATHLYLFLFPCCCAAYITDTCGGIYSRINRTTSTYWPAGHPFRDRGQLTLFTAYAKDRQCVFKIGRLTFTSSVAWISLLLGSTGILFHFF